MTASAGGGRVDVHADVAIVNSRRHDASGDLAGAAWIFRRNGSSWVEETRLLASDGRAWYPFGDGVDDTFVQFDGTVCEIVEDPAGTFNAICVAEVDHFSEFAEVAPLDNDNDGLPDRFPPDDESTFGTNPLVPDTDSDRLLDGTEVDVAQGTGCPDPLNPDSDGEGLLDGEEVSLGTDPCETDTDADGIPDDIDPFPKDPGGTTGYVEDELRSLSAYIDGLDLSWFVGPNDNARRGRRNALANRANAAANETAAGDYAAAISVLRNLLRFVGLVEPSPDWMVDSPERDHVVEKMDEMIVWLEALG